MTVCVSRCYHKKELQVQACDWPQAGGEKVEAGLGTLRNRELKEEGENCQEVGVDVVKGELHIHSTGPTHTHTKWMRIISRF